MNRYVEEYRKLDEHAGKLEEVAEDYRSRAEDDRWDQCRIAYEAVESGEFTKNSFAKSVERSHEHIRRQYLMWERYGVAPRGATLPGYWEAQAEIRNHSTGEDRTREIAREGVRRLPAEDKRETFKELARDPDVIDDEDTVAEIARDPGVRRQVQKQATSDAREANARTIESDDTLRGTVEEGTDAAVLESLHRALTSIRRASRLSSSLETTASQREVYADLLGQLSDEIEIARFNLDVAEATSVGGGQR